MEFDYNVNLVFGCHFPEKIPRWSRTNQKTS